MQVVFAPGRSFLSGPPEGVHARLMSWSADFPDPEGFFPPVLATSAFYSDEEITALLAQARARSDQEERIRLFREIDRLLVAERCAALPMAYGGSVLLRRPWVHGLHATPLAPSTPLDQVVVSR